MQNLDFILALEKDSLNQMRLDLERLNNRKSGKNQDISLNMVRFDEFCYAMLDLVAIQDGMKQFNFKTEELISFIRSMSLFFDSVDVDSRGFISFVDFSNFCLRVGRMQFKPSIKRSITTYTQDLTNSPQFPISKLCFIPHAKTLFTFDADTPAVRMFRKDGRFMGKMNPVSILKRTLKLKAPSGSLTYHDKKMFGKEFTRAKNAERDLNPIKGRINGMCFVDSTKQYVFLSSASYIIFCGCGSGGLKSEADLNIQGYVKTNYPQLGILYSKPLDLILTWPGEGSDHMFEVWDPHTKALRLRIERHAHKILTVCEVTLDPQHPLNSHYFASSSIDSKIVLWSSAPISALTYKSNKMLRVSEALQYELKGHHYAVRCLVYAPDHELILGAGFDFDVYAWDPNTRDIVMRLVGHFKSLTGMALVVTPNEKIATIDEGGVIKVWNIDKEQGLFGEQVQTLQVNCPLPVQINDFSAAFNNGGTLAILAERLYMVSIEPESVDNIRPVPKGLGYSEGSSRMWSITRNAINIINLTNGQIIKRLAFLDQDRVSSEDIITNKQHQESLKLKEQGAADRLSHGGSCSDFTKDSKPKFKISEIDDKDTITAVASDVLGKKVFLGSMDGRVFIFDSYTFGLLAQLTNENDDPHFRSQGSVVGLHYCQRDELVIALYSNGAVKILVGCHRTNINAIPVVAAVPKANLSMTMGDSFMSTTHFTGPLITLEGDDNDNPTAEYPSGGGGKPPTRPYLLRENDIGAITDNSMNSVTYSEHFDIIATSCKDGYIFLYDYITLEVLSVFRIPKFEDSYASCIEIQFVPDVPVLLAIDNFGRVTAWTVRPMNFKWIHTWSVYHNITYDQSAAFTGMSTWSSRASVLSDLRGSATVNAPLVGLQLTCLQCYLWNEKPNPENTNNNSSDGGNNDRTATGGGERGGGGGFKRPPMRRKNSAAMLKDTVKATRDEPVTPPACTSANATTAGTNNPPGKLTRQQSRLERQRSKRNLIAEEARSNASTNTLKPSETKPVWSIMIGDEAGNLMCQNITLLIERSGAAVQVDTKVKHQPVYQRIKTRPRHLGKTTVPGSVAQMIAHPIGDFEKMDLVTQTRMSGLHVKYAIGVRKWIAYSGDPIRIILAVDNTKYAAFHKTSEGMPFTTATATSGFAATSGDNGGTVLGAPEAVYTVSELGVVKMWSWDGQQLGQLREEDLQLNANLAAKAKAAPVVSAASAAVAAATATQEGEEKISLIDHLNSCTFITTVVMETTSDEQLIQAKQATHDKPMSTNALHALHNAHHNGSSNTLTSPSKQLQRKMSVNVVRKPTLRNPFTQTKTPTAQLTTNDLASQVLGTNRSFTVTDAQHEGWIFPTVSVKTYDGITTNNRTYGFGLNTPKTGGHGESSGNFNFSSRDLTSNTSSHSNGGRITRYTVNQFAYFTSIVSWVLPHINRYVSNLHKTLDDVVRDRSFSNNNYSPNKRIGFTDENEVHQFVPELDSPSAASNNNKAQQKTPLFLSSSSSSRFGSGYLTSIAEGNPKKKLPVLSVVIPDPNAPAPGGVDDSRGGAGAEFTSTENLLEGLNSFFVRRSSVADMQITFAADNTNNSGNNKLTHAKTAPSGDTFLLTQTDDRDKTPQQQQNTEPTQPPPASDVERRLSTSKSAPSLLAPLTSLKSANSSGNNNSGLTSSLKPSASLLSGPKPALTSPVRPNSAAITTTTTGGATVPRPVSARSPVRNRSSSFGVNTGTGAGIDTGTGNSTPTTPVMLPSEFYDPDVDQGAYLASLGTMNVVNDFQEEIVRKRQDKLNLVGLIDYIQDSDYFVGDLKHATSSSQIYGHLDREVDAKRRKDPGLLDVWEDPIFGTMKTGILGKNGELMPSPSKSRVLSRPRSALPITTSSSVRNTLSRPQSASTLMKPKKAFAEGERNDKSEGNLLPVPLSSSRPFSATTSRRPLSASASSRTLLSKSMTRMDSILSMFDKPSMTVHEEVNNAPETVSIEDAFIGQSQQQQQERNDTADQRRDSRRFSALSVTLTETQINKINTVTLDQQNAVVSSSSSSNPIRATISKNNNRPSTYTLFSNESDRCSPSVASPTTTELDGFTSPNPNFNETTAGAETEHKLTHCKSERCLEISKKFHEAVRSDSHARPVYAFYDPLAEMKEKRAQKKLKAFTSSKKKSNMNDFKEYIDVETHEFSGVTNVGKDYEREQLRIAKDILQKGNEADRKLYGPYTSKDIFAYLNLTYQLEPLSRAEIEILAPEHRNDNRPGADDCTPYAGQLIYSIDYLNNSTVIAQYPSIIEALRSLVERKHVKVATENDFILHIFAYADDHCRARIFQFARVARMFYSLMQNAQPARDNAAKLKTKLQNRTATSTSATAATITSVNGATTSPEGGSGSGGGLDDRGNETHHSTSSGGSGPRPISQIGLRYIVKPHHRRLFRKWSVKKKEFTRICRYFDNWSEGKHDSLCIQELVEIFQSMVPKVELEMYRVLNIMPLLVNRIDYRMSTELTGEVIQRLFENVFEIKIIPG